MAWSIWLFAGFVLLLLEVITPGGFYVFFIGIAAVLVGLLSVFLPLPLWLQIVLFALFSVVAMLLFRKPLLEWFGARTKGVAVDRLEDESAIALDDIAANAFGRAELRGASWSARNVGAQPVARGERCAVEKVDGLTLWIRGSQGE